MNQSPPNFSPMALQSSLLPLPPPSSFPLPPFPAFSSIYLHEASLHVSYPLPVPPSTSSLISPTPSTPRFLSLSLPSQPSRPSIVMKPVLARLAALRLARCEERGIACTQATVKGFASRWPRGYREIAWFLDETHVDVPDWLEEEVSKPRLPGTKGAR